MNNNKEQHIHDSTSYIRYIKGNITQNEKMKQYMKNKKAKHKHSSHEKYKE